MDTLQAKFETETWILLSLMVMILEELLSHEGCLRVVQLLLVLVCLPFCLHLYTDVLEMKLSGRFVNPRSASADIIKAVYFTGVAAFAAFVGYSEGWLLTFDLDPLMHPVQEVEVPDHTVRFFILQLGFYLQDMMFPVPTGGTDKDGSNLQYRIHHILAIVLTCACMHTGFWNLGVLVVLLHDVSNVLLYISKARYSLTNRKGGRLAFLSFAAVFFVSRLVLFPYVLFVFLKTEPWLWMENPSFVVGYCAFLVGLVPLHALWGVKIIRVLTSSKQKQ